MAKETDKKQVSRVKIKKKAWVRIVAPASFGQQEIGETYVESTESMIGRKAITRFTVTLDHGQRVIVEP